MTSSSPDYFAFLEPWFCVSPSTFCPGPWVNSVGHLCTPPVGEVVTAPNSLVALEEGAPQQGKQKNIPRATLEWPSCHNWVMEVENDSELGAGLGGSVQSGE